MAEGEITTFTALMEKFNLPAGNYKKPKLLYCSNGGHFLRILPDGTVDGTRDRSDQHSKHPSLLQPPAFLVSQVKEASGEAVYIWVPFLCLTHSEACVQGLGVENNTL